MKLRVALPLVYGALLASLMASSALGQPSGPATVLDAFAQIGTRVPAFGGMFVDEGRDTVYVFLVPGQTGTVAEVDEAMSDVFGLKRPAEHRFELCRDSILSCS
jgi:hypothetical protein